MNELRNLVEKYSGPPLYAICLGGPGCFAQLLSIPGSSRILSGIEYPYSREAQAIISPHFFDPDYSSVSEQTVDILQDYIENNHGPDVLSVSCTTAMVTNRVRKGKERAYIGIGDHRYYLEFFKHADSMWDAEEKSPLWQNVRIHQDTSLSFVMSSLILDPDFTLGDNPVVRSLEKIR